MRNILAAQLFALTLLFACNDSDTNNDIDDTNAIAAADSTEVSDTLQTEDPVEVVEEPVGESWQNFNDPYSHFNGTLSDTVYIGPNRKIKDPYKYFSENRSNQFVIIEEGEYTGTSAISLQEENLILEGRGKVSLILDQLYDNVMWVTGNNIVVNNLHMTHLQPGGLVGQNCSGRVIGFDGADNITIVNCDLNGCGLAGLHDNLGNGKVYVEHNYIHNNSLGAYTDIDNNIWQQETEHPVFQFKNNRIEDNGHGLEEDLYEDDFHGDH